MATTTTIIKESNLVLWSVVCKDLEPRSDGRPCPHQHLRLGSHLSIVCYQGVAMLCTTRVIHRMSSEYVAYPTIGVTYTNAVESVSLIGKLYSNFTPKEEEAVFISVVTTNEDPPNAHQAQHRPKSRVR